ncbi:unnamed protein product [Schistosoma curassoni]|uniref:Uncharacterized protein n=1 Tax=Schistosoma curassoni TaxID=6186 RepID=A0A183KFI9_9TREM|nr:unnamed protein product [Schistosoma curassoni]
MKRTIRTQGHSGERVIKDDLHFRENITNNSLINCKALNKGEQKFGDYLSYCKRLSSNPCAYRHAIRFKGAKARPMKSVCQTTVHFATSDDEPCSLCFC